MMNQTVKDGRGTLLEKAKIMHATSIRAVVVEVVAVDPISKRIITNVTDIMSDHLSADRPDPAWEIWDSQVRAQSRQVFRELLAGNS